MFGWFGRMLTFEVEADEAVSLGDLLADCSAGAIAVTDASPIAGFAAHGSSVADSLRALIELHGVELTEREDALRAIAATPVLLDEQELGCGADGPSERIERIRDADSTKAASLAMGYYDADRDYQAGQMRASSGGGGVRDERVELPAVLGAATAKTLVEQALARRWQSGERIRLRLPPERMGLRPGDSIQLPGTARAWTVKSASIEAMAVSVEAVAAPVEVLPLPADPGRATSEPDLAVGRSELLLAELPPAGDVPEAAARVWLAASNAGAWKPVPVELAQGEAPLQPAAIARRAILGRTETVLAAASAMTLDEQSAVDVRLANATHVMLNADQDALVGGANLALIGEELVQFGRAEPLGNSRFRLSRLLRGRRGTEWASGSHVIGEPFLLIGPAAMVAINLTPSAVGAAITATAHGIGDFEPLPSMARTVNGEAMRPPTPCHLRAGIDAAGLTLQWVRRSYRGWAWLDAIGDAADPFPERYRVIVTGPAGEVVAETSVPSASLAAAELPGVPGQSLQIAVQCLGPAAASHPIVATVTL